ncbi:hypothetical protein MPSEU_000303600 [Mayamaea pseudoterrestris]|nr:hypothetical protein MPSEU_000303600 [Mayamaea pseudoterrestris]
MQQTWQTLVDWVHEHGGFVHPQLALQAIDGNENHRGVFARSDISWNELLIRLSPSLVLSGKHLPGNYVAEQQQQENVALSAQLLNWKPYLDSLPVSYETLWQWTKDEKRQYLAGTSIIIMQHDAYDNQDEVIQQRYLTQIRPYLEHVGVVVPLASVVSDSEYERFSKACQAIRTRCFHLVKTQNDAAGVSTGAIADSSSHDDDDDNGPTFLPVMDLLNHASSPSDIHTTIRMQADGSLVMVAERDILANTQLLHSYASTRGEMTAAETLSTYGFVSDERIQQACEYDCNATLPITTTMSSMLLSKRAVLDACRSVIASNVPMRLAAAIKAQQLPDETWEVTVDEEHAIADVGSDDDDDDYIVIQYDPCNPDTLWSDDLVTLTCLPFLPAGAADEVKDSLLDKSVLEDYFLGKLVCATMLRVIHERQTSYTNITYKGGDYDDDFKLLRELQLVSTGSNERSQSQLRLQYALAVRIEEKITLDALRKEVMKVLASLDDDDDDCQDTYFGLEESSVSKRQKM